MAIITTGERLLDRARLGRKEGVEEDVRLKTEAGARAASERFLNPEPGETPEQTLRASIGLLIDSDPQGALKLISGVKDPQAIGTRLIQTPEGQEIVADVPGQQFGPKPVKPTAKKFPTPLTEAAQTKIGEATQALDRLNSLSQSLAKVIIAGDVGIIQGNINAVLLSLNAANPDVTQFQAMADLVSLGTAKTENGGRPTQPDFLLVRKTLSDIRNREETALGLMANARANARFFAADVFLRKINFNPENEEQLRAEATRAGLDLVRESNRMARAKKITGSKSGSLELLKTVELLKMMQENPKLGDSLIKKQKQAINKMLDQMNAAGASVEDFF